MKLARVRTPTGTVQGEYEPPDDGPEGRGSPDAQGGAYGGATVRADGTTYAVGEDADLLAPCEPTALYCVGRNYGETVDRMGYEVPDEPDFFIKPPVSVHPPGAPIEYPSFTDEFTYAGELAAVIDRQCTDLAPAAVPDAVRGYTVMNDLDCLDQPGRTARKAFDGSAPLGPAIETDVDPGGLGMYTTVAGEERQRDDTRNMLFDPHEVVSFLSARFTFHPGDVVAFGSPANPGLLDPGDEVAITYEGVGTLLNRVEG